MPFEYPFAQNDLAQNPAIDPGNFIVGSHKKAHNTEAGRKCFEICCSLTGSLMLSGSVLSAPKKPPMPAIEPMLLRFVGVEAFDDGMKRYIGRVIRFVIEELGGEHRSYGNNVTVTSYFSKGSTYRFTGWHPLH